MIIEQSYDWETSEGWEKFVCEAVNKYPMAPRWAKEVLDEFGKLCAHGVPVHEVVNRLLQMQIEVIDRKLAILKPKVEKDIKESRSQHRKLWNY